MQARNTLAQGYGLNWMTAAATGIALLVASALGVAVLSDQVELPLISGSSEISAPPNTNQLTEITFSEQNVWEYQGAIAPRLAEAIRFAEDNSFDYAAPVTAEPVQFIEENVWEYASPAHPAGDAETSNVATDYRFLEENTSRESSALPSGDLGQRDY